MDIAVQQSSFVQRAFLAVYLCLNVARTQVQHKESLQLDTTLLDRSRNNHQRYDHHSDGNYDGVSQMAQPVTDEEDIRHGNDDAHQNSKQQGQTVLVALLPKLPPLLRTVFLHDHSAQEW